MFHVRLLPVVMLLSAALCASCLRGETPPGVVAVVNGEAISLHELEAADDMYRGGVQFWTEDGVMPVDEVRARYRETLARLIVERLMLQELRSRGLLPSDEDVQAFENLVRDDYGEGGFEESLLEELVDLDEWRAHLRTRLSRRVFRERILGGMLSVSDKDVAAYYARHKAEFMMPAMREFLLVSGVDRKPVEDARGRISAPEGKIGTDVDLRSLTVADSRLPEQWLQEMDQSGPDVPGPVALENGRYRFLMLKRRIPAHQQPFGKVAGRIRDAMIEGRTEQAFRRWLEQAMERSAILVATGLSPLAGPRSRAVP